MLSSGKMPVNSLVMIILEIIRVLKSQSSQGQQGRRTALTLLLSRLLDIHDWRNSTWEWRFMSAILDKVFPGLLLNVLRKAEIFEQSQASWMRN